MLLFQQPIEVRLNATEGVSMVKKIYKMYRKKRAEYIQVVLLISALLIGVITNILSWQNEENVIIELLMINIAAITTSSIKQGRMFELSRQDNGKIFSAGDFDLIKVLNSTKHLFISAIAMNGILSGKAQRLINYLNEGKTLYLLMIDPQKLSETAKNYCGLQNKNGLYKCNIDICNKCMISLDLLRNKDKYFPYFEKKQILLRTCLHVMSSSYVAGDCFIHGRYKRERTIKIMNYVYAETMPEREPCFAISSSNGDWYEYYVKNIELEWNDARIIESEEDLELLYQEFQDLRDSFEAMIKNDRK